jgi:hypothetical protein
MRSTPLRLCGCLLIFATLTFRTPAALPAPPNDADLADFPIHYTPDAPGPFDASFLIDKPAGRLGPVVARDGHFYTGERRIRFWGVNICFAGCFPTHEQADKLANRLARFGINAVRFHHMDSAPWPRGIFADRKLETLSPLALERLDYFITALKKQGVYSNLNLHVSRSWSKAHNWENADKLSESYDKLIDIFHPDLIAANKQYARDLLTHVNQYAGTTYAAEPAVCMVEINNEDTLFLWGGERALAKLPEPYAGTLNGLWNQWLVSKYGTRDKLALSWNRGATPLGPNLLSGKWNVEQHGLAKMTAQSNARSHALTVTSADGTGWHIQFNQSGLKLRNGQFYTISFQTESTDARSIDVSVTQAHDPWGNLGLGTSAKTSSIRNSVSPEIRLGFVATADEDNARVSFAVGQARGQVLLNNVQFREGGQQGLNDDEDAARRTVAPHAIGPYTEPRKTDWYDFLQQTDETYFTGMRDFLKNELKVQAPVTGTIGLGPLGTLSQSKMDFVDAHAYWDHPRFPNNDWSRTNWTISNKAMVDEPANATFWKLAATRVVGKPFTVTEYNHAAPNEWQAECIPMIATYAALQDWDGVFLFAYSHSDQYEKDHISSFFDIEGNPVKMMPMPLGARIFLGGAVEPLSPVFLHAPREALLPDASTSYYDTWRFATRAGTKWPVPLISGFGLAFKKGYARNDAVLVPGPWQIGRIDNHIAWGAKPDGGRGRFIIGNPTFAMFTGFAMGNEQLPLCRQTDARFPIELSGALLEASQRTLTKLDTPFCAMLILSADAKSSVAKADRLLIFAAGRAFNQDTKWNDARTTISDNWGQSPPRVEVVKATLTLPHDYTAKALDSAGRTIKQFETTNKTLRLGDAPTICYELIRK